MRTHPHDTNISPGRADWLSLQAAEWFAADQIAANRQGIADTYVKSPISIEFATVK